MRTSNLSVLKRLDALVQLALARANGAAVPGNKVVTPLGGVTPSDLSGTTTAPIIVSALDVTPVRAGTYRVAVVVNYTLSAADEVTWVLGAVPTVTAITGGTTVGNVHYESGTPVVVTGGSPSAQIGSSATVATGQIAHATATVTGLVAVGAKGVRAAITLTAVTVGGAHITGITLIESAVEEP